MIALSLACSHEHDISDQLVHEHEPDHVHDTGVDEDEIAWEALLDEAVDRYTHDGPPGVAFAVVLDGRLAYAAALGDATYGSDIPLTTDTVMRWNSVSKMHVALAAMQLAKEGIVDLEEPVSTYLPEASIDGDWSPDDLTLHQAMTHTTALPDWWDTSCSPSLSEHWTDSAEALHAEPGTLYNYSNVGWSLAGAVLESASGTEFTELMRAWVIDPAGMETATFDVAEVTQHPYSIGYSNGAYYTPDLNDCPWLRPAGWLHGSVEDLAHSVEAQLAGDLVDAGVWVGMHAQHPTYTASLSSAGYGYFAWSEGDVQLVGHGGSGGGHRSYVLMVPEEDFGVVVVANSGTWNPYGLAHSAIELFLGELDEPDPEEVRTDPDGWTKYEGTYEDSDGVGTVELSLGATDPYLYVRFVDGTDTWYRMYQDGRDEFFFLQNGWNYVRLVPGDDDTVRYFASRYYVAERGAPAGPPPPRAQVEELEVRGAHKDPREPGEPLF
ncbi:MAG TPA: serine hydrolase domain-containing protein [Myxococcota bacterium]|nr:serine hydrolase domain-containing protein [Myxococcota bacterium]